MREGRALGKAEATTYKQLRKTGEEVSRLGYPGVMGCDGYCIH